MDLRIIYAVLLSMLPISELRGGLPWAIIFAEEHGIPIAFVFLLIILANIVAVFIAFYFLDNLHHLFLKNESYKKFFEFYISKIQKKIDTFEKKYSATGFLALTLFVAIPLPATGAWSGVLIAWILGLDRNKSIWAISLGVVIAGILVLAGTLSFLNFLS
jgi:uncharacterized membrane protein